MADFVDDYTYDTSGRVISVHQHGLSGGNAVADITVALAYNTDDTLASIDRYVTWTVGEGLPFDPWLRVHARLGARIAACETTRGDTLAA